MKYLIRTKFGSHLYGTNTDKSDKDFKIVFIPTVKQLVLGVEKQNWNESTKTGQYERNTSSDVDVGYLSLKYFLTALADGDLSAIEVLFSPKESWINEPDPLWHKIVQMKNYWLSSSLTNLSGFVKNRCDPNATNFVTEGPKKFKTLYQFVRIITQANELLTTGKLIFPRPNWKLLLDIKEENISEQQIITMLKIYINQFQIYQEQSILPKQVNREFIEQFVFDTYVDYIKNNS